MAIQEVLVSKIFNYTSEPTKKVEGQFWFNPSTNVLSRYNGTAWKPITVSSDDVAVLSDGSKISLTNYLNTQIAALAEGIDSKQDKLIYYSENTSNYDSSISAPYVNLEAAEFVNIKGQSAIELIADTSHVLVSAGNQSIRLDAEEEETEGSITVNGNITGSAISTSIPTSDAVDTKVVSEKAVKTELDKKQDKLLYYSETPGSPSSVTNIKLMGSVAEGNRTTASGQGSHAEGSYATASGSFSHAEGVVTTASGDYSHAEGEGTTASSAHQHAQGKYNIEDANAKYADIIGNGTSVSARSNAATVSWDGITWSQTDVRAGGADQDSATYSLAALSEGKQDKLKFYSEIDKSDDTSTDSTGSEINLKTLASQYGGSKINIFASQGEAVSGKINLTSQAYSNGADGGAITLLSDGVQGDGGEITLKAKTVYENSGPGGNINIIAEPTSDDPGSNILLSANSIQLDGNLKGTALNTSIPATTDDNHILTTKAVKTELDKKQDKLLYYSETSGDTPSATISVANIKLTGKVAEGSNTTAEGNYSHAEGINTTASGHYSHAEGYNTTASGYASHAEGRYTTALGKLQHVQGIYNIEDANDKYADIIGNGAEDQGVSNAQTVSWTGITWSQTDVRAGGADQDSAAHSLSAKQNATDNNLTTIDKTIVGAINGLNTRIDNSSGMLYFTSSSYGTNGTFSAGEVFSVAYRTDFQFAIGSATANQYRSWSIGHPASSNISIVALADDRLRVLHNGGGFCSYRGSDIRPVIKPINDIVIIVTNPTGGNMNTSLYVNGVQIPQASYSAQPSLKMKSYRLNAMNYSTSTIDTTMKDFAIFNFDMSAADAPYSIADYSAGKPVPPSLKRNGGIFSSDPNMGASTSGGWAINTPDGSAIVTKGAWRCFSAVYYCYNRTGDLPAGVEYAIDLSTKVSSAGTSDAFLCNIGQGTFGKFNNSRFKGRLSFWYRKNNTDTSASSTLSVQIAKLVIASVSGADVSDSDWHFFSEEIDMTLTNIASGGFLAVSSYAASGTFTDYPWSIADLKLEAYTQEVGLENYTFTVGSTQYIPDASGNNHDITAGNTGIVAGTFDVSIAKLASLITSTNA